MRRPAHFSASPAGTSVIPIALAAQHAPEPAPHAPPMWQDDGRFAIALLVVLIGINLGVMLWLSVLAPGPRVTVVSQSSGAIAASLAPQSGGGVTVYTPDDAEAPAATANPVLAE
jgi:hypothetical protein